MFYWEYELYVKALSDLIEQENKKQQGEMKKYHMDKYMDAASSGDYSKIAPTPKMPTMPSMPGSFKM